MRQLEFITKGQPTPSSVHVNKPMGEEDIDDEGALPPELNNQEAKVIKDDKKKPRRIATVAVRHGDHLLMGKRRDNGKWTVPGGHVDDGEDMLTGAKRELREETGIADAEHMEDLGPMEKVAEGLHVQPFTVKFASRPDTSMLTDPDGEVKRWNWVNIKDGIPSHIRGNMHVPIERNILMEKLGVQNVEKGDHLLDGLKEAKLEDFMEMQDLVNGMDHEIDAGITDPNIAKMIAKLALTKDAGFYNDDDQKKGLKLDLGSGTFRMRGHLGIDLFPQDHGTIVHDLSTGIPFPDGSASHINAVNSLHEIDKDPKAILSEIERVLMPGGEFFYEGPNEIHNYPESLVQTDFESNEEEVEKVASGPTYRQTFRRMAGPDPATADDAEPRTGVRAYDDLPADALLAMDALGYYYSDATTSARGNREMYASQGALAKNDDSKPHPLLELVDDMPLTKALKKIFNKISKSNKVEESDEVSIAMYALGVETEIKKSSLDPDPGKDLKASDVVPIFKSDLKKQLVYGVVLSPDEVDAQEDWMTTEDIEKAAHHYMKVSRVVGVGHTKPTDAEVVESYIAPQDFETTEGQYGPQKVKKGSWVLGVKVNDKKEWQKVVDGDYTGFSVGGFGLRDPASSANL